jgi:hypothetical protein
MANHETLPNPEKLRYITKNFRTLQGLRFLPMGILVFLLELTDILQPTHPLLGGLISALSFIAVIAYFRYGGTDYIENYYERRFGWIEPQRLSSKDALTISAVLLALIPLYLFRHQADLIIWQIDQQLHLWIGDPNCAVNLFPLFFWVLCLLGKSRSPSKADWNRTSFFAFGTTVCIFIAFYPRSHPEIMNQELWRILNATLFGLSLMIFGLYDHLTLLHLLPKRTEDDSNE